MSKSPFWTLAARSAVVTFNVGALPCCSTGVYNDSGVRVVRSDVSPNSFSGRYRSGHLRFVYRQPFLKGAAPWLRLIFLAILFGRDLP